jgi:hypothetical protein
MSLDDFFGQLLLYCLELNKNDVLLPEHCSAKVEGEECQLAPSYVVSVMSDEGEFMLAVVCDDHKDALEPRLFAMQKAKKLPQGIIQLQPIKAVVTDCVTGIDEGYIGFKEKKQE